MKLNEKLKLVQDIKSWPPGSTMCYDNRDLMRQLLNEKHITQKQHDEQVHFGLGLVVTNDGKQIIHVVWDNVSNEKFKEYDVRFLNPLVISRVE
jgi:hypothetical protein